MTAKEAIKMLKKMDPNTEVKVEELTRKIGTFIYNGRDDVAWYELPLEVRKRDYPYYFNDKGEDCYPYRTDRF